MSVDNAPSDRVRAYAEAIHRIRCRAPEACTGPMAMDRQITRAVMAVADREQAELRAERDQYRMAHGLSVQGAADLREQRDEWVRRAEKAEATIARVEALAKVNATSAHALGHEDERRRWLDLLAVLERAALRDPEPTEETRLVCPECAVGKCANCNGDAWDDAKDEVAACKCRCRP